MRIIFFNTFKTESNGWKANPTAEKRMEWLKNESNGLKSESNRWTVNGMAESESNGSKSELINDWKAAPVHIVEHSVPACKGGLRVTDIQVRALTFNTWHRMNIGWCARESSKINKVAANISNRQTPTCCANQNTVVYILTNHPDARNRSRDARKCCPHRCPWQLPFPHRRSTNPVLGFPQRDSP